ncbi:hypothetical protein BRC72_01015 [Halobacteriales archaeon QH_7_66_36]|nr:MAG: hypothetical protein BRC72_01015 [Halobacteriales archaeon QH_7_66_36]
MMFDHDALEAARDRLPDPAEDRPAEVDDALETGERIGFGEGEPLANVGYDEYPDDVLHPSAGDVLRVVANHELVTEHQDVADELGTSVSRAEKAAEHHGVELPSGGSFEVETATGTIDVPLADGPVHLDDCTDDPADDHRLMHHLTVICGMGVAEVVAFLERAVNDARGGDARYSVREGDVKDTLREMNLMNGATTAQRERERRRRGPEADELNRGRHTTTTVTPEFFEE